MDPITIATTIASAAKAAKAAWDTGESLYLFIKSTQNVTKTVQDLAKSVKAFGDTCDLVHSSLETLEAAYESNKGTLKSIQFGSDQLVWRGIQGRLEECQEIIQELRKSMSDVTKEHSSFVGQAWRQFKLNAKQEDRTVIQARLQNHTTALSLSLQAIKM
jgi:DNA repair ATPase RecN